MPQFPLLYKDDADLEVLLGPPGLMCLARASPWAPFRGAGGPPLAGVRAPAAVQKLPVSAPLCRLQG